MIHFLSKTSRRALGSTVLLRLDFNAEDIWRLEASLPTIEWLIRRGLRVVIVSHRGRPAGVRIKNGLPHGRDAKKFSLRSDAETLARLIRRPIIFVPHFRFKDIKRSVAAAKRGTIFLLENLRFLPGEERNDVALARQLAALADSYVNDAFAVSHRADASIVAITKRLPSFAGLEMEKEIRHLTRLIRRPKHPLVLIVGGAKAHDKLGILKYFRTRAKCFLVGGGSANTLLMLRGIDVGSSLVDRAAADQPMFRAASRFPHLILPVDWRANARGRILDIGSKTGKIFAREIARAKTILWSGPMGYIEDPRYAKGNLVVARAIAKNRRAFSVTGGGETVSFLKSHKLDGKFSFISTGGGAMLDYLAGEKLPGIAALKK
ncbi:MAG: phosphoglycerate kinase [Patescibacteria group bacterium]